MRSSSLPPLAPLPRARRARAPRKTASAAVYKVTPATRQLTCSNCEHLPAGSMELAALLLVLVFSLSAVLFTSVYANKVQGAKISALQGQIEAYQHVE